MITSVDSFITLCNGVIITQPLNLHIVWARAGHLKLGLGSCGISLIDVLITLCIKDISSICPNYEMPNAQLPENVLALEVDMNVLKSAYAKYADIFCHIPIIEWKVIKQEVMPYLDTSII